MWWMNLCLIHFFKVQAQCTGNGLMNSCACNFINACTYDAIKKKFVAFSGPASDLKKFVPNVRSFASITSQVAEICEPGSIGIIYDCKNRIPLAATIVLTADQYEERLYTRPTLLFQESSQIGHDFQQNDIDYTMPLKRVPCYESINKYYYIEQNWYNALCRSWASSQQKCTAREMEKKSTVHRGHLIAASYGRGTPDRTIQTFIYTNAVPQFGKKNSGAWRVFESKLIVWATNNCKKAPLHVIVGSIPSTYRANNRRFFGEAGFSEFMGPSKLFPGKAGYRVNVPAYMWTAACCHSASSPSFTVSTGFFAPNKPGRRLVKSVALRRLFSSVRAIGVDLFPDMLSCNEDGNYVPL